MQQTPLRSAERLFDGELERCRRAERLHLLLDYDGTLVPIAPTPREASADDRLIALLSELCRSPRYDVHIVSGRVRADLDYWFGHLDVSLWAEHGFWHRPAARRTWHPCLPPDRTWMPQVYEVLDGFAANTPGAWVERKSASLAWHYRAVAPLLVPQRLTELREHLSGVLAPLALELLDGHRVVEVRRAGAGKARVASWLREQVPLRGDEKAVTAAFGDDLTDDELFAALPETAITVAVGQPLPHARFQLPSPHETRAWLQRLSEATLDPASSQI